MNVINVGCIRWTAGCLNSTPYREISGTSEGNLHYGGSNPEITKQEFPMVKFGEVRKNLYLNWTRYALCGFLAASAGERGTGWGWRPGDRAEWTVTVGEARAPWCGRSFFAKNWHDRSRDGSSYFISGHLLSLQGRDVYMPSRTASPGAISLSVFVSVTMWPHVCYFKNVKRREAPWLDNVRCPTEPRRGAEGPLGLINVPIKITPQKNFKILRLWLL